MASETQVTPDDMNLAQAKAIAWHEINTRDVTGSRDFYSNLLGWTVQTMPMGEMGDYTMFAVDGAPFSGIFDLSRSEEAANVPPHWSVYFNCDDVDASAAKAETLGGKILAPAFDVPTVGRICLIQDPQGATFWLFKGDKS